jgi:hypothetical protein
MRLARRMQDVAVALFDSCECSYAFPVRYEEGGGIWPHTDIADNEVTLTLQLEVMMRSLGQFSFVLRLTLCS